MALLGIVPNRGIFPEGNHLPRSEDPSPPARDHDVGNRPYHFRSFMAIPKIDGREYIHGFGRRILAGEAKKEPGT